MNHAEKLIGSSTPPGTVLEEELTTPAVREKKKRGRPPKNPLNVAAATGIVFRKPKPHRPRRDPNRVPTEQELFTDHQTYCEELLSIRDKKGELIPFKWNYTQERLAEMIDGASKEGYRHFLIL